jgi:hypothetical protein
MTYRVLDEGFSEEMESQERFRNLCPRSDYDKVNLKDLQTLLTQRAKWELMLGVYDYEAKTQALSRTLLGDG